MEFAASFDTQLSSLAPFIFYTVVAGIVFIETGLLFGFFLPGDSILFSAGLVAAAHGNINIEVFYEKYGWWAVVIARFFPWIRTFVPPIAGAAKMNYYKFLSANALGALVWGVGITLAGYYAATVPWVKSSSYALAAFFITASLISVLVKNRRHPQQLLDKS